MQNQENVQNFDCRPNNTKQYEIVIAIPNQIVSHLMIFQKHMKQFFMNHDKVNLIDKVSKVFKPRDGGTYP